MYRHSTYRAAETCWNTSEACKFCSQPLGGDTLPVSTRSAWKTVKCARRDSSSNFQSKFSIDSTYDYECACDLVFHGIKWASPCYWFWQYALVRLVKGYRYGKTWTVSFVVSVVTVWTQLTHIKSSVESFGNTNKKRVPVDTSLWTQLRKTAVSKYSRCGLDQFGRSVAD